MQRVGILISIFLLVIIACIFPVPVFVNAKVITPSLKTKSDINLDGQKLDTYIKIIPKDQLPSFQPVSTSTDQYLETSPFSRNSVAKILNYQSAESNARAWGKYFGLADSVVKIKEYSNISIKGSDKFIKKVEVRLNSIADSQYGQELLKNLKDTGRKIRIIEYSGNNSYAEAKDLKKATQKDEIVRDGNGTIQKTWLGKAIIGTGEGTDVTVHLNPDLDFKGIKGCTGYMPNDAVFFHELTHAQRMMQGRLLETKDKQYDTLEEKRAINGEHPNETDYLIEIKAPYIRFSHTCQMVKI